MRKYEEDVIDANGNAVSGATVDIYNQGTLVHATIYSDNGVTPISNPVSTNASGTYKFYIASGRYDITISGNGFTTRTKSDVEIVDVIDNLDADTLLTATWASPAAIGSGVPAAGTFTSLTQSGQAAPAVSSAGTGRVYFDSTANRYLLSENTGAYRYFGGNFLNSQGPLAPIVGTGADATIFTYVLPANTLLAGKGLRVFAVWKHSTGTANATYKVKLGSTTLNTSGAVNDSVFDSSYNVSIFNAAGVQNSQYMGGVTNLGLATAQTFTVDGTSAENTANALALTFTFSVAATDQITPLFFLVELVN